MDINLHVVVLLDIQSLQFFVIISDVAVLLIMHFRL